jgi:hypothetical protein
VWKSRRQAIALALLVALCSAPAVGAAGAPPRPPQDLEIRFQIGSDVYWVDGEAKQADAVPFIKDDRSYVPVRFLAESIGATVDWSEAEQKVTLTFRSGPMELYIGRRALRFGGRDADIPVAPIIVGDRTYLPARFVAEAAGYTVDWIDESQSVVVKRAWTYDFGSVSRPPVWVFGQPGLDYLLELGASGTAWSVYYVGRNPEDARYLQALHRAGFTVVSNLPSCQGHSALDPELVSRCACRAVDGSVIYLDLGTNAIRTAYMCSNNPEWRERLRTMVKEHVDGGADAILFDETLGTAGGLHLGACFCRYCTEGFRQYLAGHFAPADLLARFGIADVTRFDYGGYLRAAGVRIAWDDLNHELYLEYLKYLLGSQRDLVAELVGLAHEYSGGNALLAGNTYGMRPMYVPLADLLDFTIFELSVQRPPASRNAGVYLLALAVSGDKPFSGFPDIADLASLSPEDGPLWRHWLAESLACAGSFMMPYRAFTMGAGEYTLAAEEVAPYFRFVQAHASAYDARDPYANVAVLFDFKSSVLDWEMWQNYLATASALVEAHVPFTVLVQGDNDLLTRSVSVEDLSRFAAVVLPPDHLPGVAQTALAQYQGRGGKVLRPASADPATIVAAINGAGILPAMTTTAPGTVGVFPMSGDSGPVVHLVNYDYDSSRRAFRDCGPFEVTLAVPSKVDLTGTSLVLLSPDGEPGEATSGGAASGTAAGGTATGADAGAGAINLQWIREGESVRIKVPGLKMYSVIVVKQSAK